MGHGLNECVFYMQLFLRRDSKYVSIAPSFYCEFGSIYILKTEISRKLFEESYM